MSMVEPTIIVGQGVLWSYGSDLSGPNWTEIDITTSAWRCCPVGAETDHAAGIEDVQHEEEGSKLQVKNEFRFGAKKEKAN